MSNDIIEFLLDSSCIASVNSSIVPTIDSLISIQKVTYRVKRITYALDFPSTISERIRADVYLEKTK